MKIFDVHQHYYPELDPDASKILKGMDKNNIEKALIMAGHESITSGVGYNEDVDEIISCHPDRFEGGVYVYPLDVASAVETVRKYYDKGFKCVKMFPAYGFFPDDPLCFPVYELITELDMLLLFHAGGADKKYMIGNTREGASFKYSMPCHYDALGHVFPDMKTVLAHLGGGITLYNMPEIISLCANHQNIYLDISCSTAAVALDIYSNTLDDYVIPLDVKKLAWGSDNVNPGITLAKNLNTVSKLANGDTKIVEDVFFGNARKLLNL